MALSDILNALATAGNVLDTPRAMLWELAQGKNPFSVANPFDEEAVANRTTGWDLLKGLGIEGQEGFDWTDPLAVGAEMALDPLNLFGAAKLASKPMEAADMAAKASRRFGGEAKELEHLSSAFDEAVPGGVKFYGIEGPKVPPGGATFPEFPEAVMMTRNRQAAKSGSLDKGMAGSSHLAPYFDVMTHEPVHAMQRTKKTTANLGKLLEEAAGGKAMKAAAGDYWGPTVWRQIFEPRRYREEAVANLIGSPMSVSHEPVWNMVRGSHDAFQSSLSGAMQNFWPDVLEPQNADAVAQIYADFLRGKYARQSPATGMQQPGLAAALAGYNAGRTTHA